MAVLSILAIHEAAEALLNCVCDALSALPAEMAGLAGCPCRTGVVAGAVAVDGCDGGCDVAPGEYPGQLTVSVNRMYATDMMQFPREVGALTTGSAGGGVRDKTRCTLPQVTAVELAVQLWRCSPGPQDNGCPPTMAALGETAMQYHADLLAVQQGISCCYPATDTVNRKGRRFVQGQTTTLGPAGGCVGFQTLITVAIDGTYMPLPTGP